MFEEIPSKREQAQRKIFVWRKEGNRNLVSILFPHLYLDCDTVTCPPKGSLVQEIFVGGIIFNDN